jgi:hypothetical protein
MPFMQEIPPKRVWRRQVAEYVLDRVDTEGWVRFVSREPGARREMIKIAEMLPADVIAEISEDAADPSLVALELRLAPAEMERDSGFRVVHPQAPAVERDDEQQWEAAGGW